MRNQLIVASTLFAMLTGPVVAQIDRTPPPVPSEAVFGPVPEFVTEHAVPAANASQFEAFGGIRIMLLDAQYDARPADPVSYRRHAIHVENTTGIAEAATLETSFDPSFQQLIYHHVRIMRDGTVEDRQDRAIIEFARFETDRDAQMFNGEVTAVMRLDDVRVGDTVDIAYSIIGQNPTFDDERFASFVIGWTLPIESLAVRSFWNPGEVGFWDVWTGDSGDIERRTTSQYESFNVEARGRDSLDMETGAPLWVNQLPTLRISTFADWQEVAEWGRPLFELPQSEAVEALAARFREEHQDRDEQLLAALRFVQDDIRYLAITYGAGSYVPASPDQTLEWRYGDCKAKTVLFIQLARALGFEADAALVSLFNGPGLQDFGPSPGAFDHVIVRLQHDGETLWIDPTQSEQGGTFETLTPADYGWALPLDGQARDLVSMDSDRHRTGEPGIFVREVIDMREGPNQPITLDVETVYTGAEADLIRYQIAALGRSGVQRNYLDFYNRTFGEAEFSERLTIEDARDDNRLILRESVWLGSPYEISSDQSMDQFNFVAHALAAIVDSNSERRRDYPLAVVHPTHARHHVEIQLPQDMPWELPDDRLEIENAAFDFSYSSREHGGVYTLEFERISHADQVGPEEALEVLREHEDMLNALYYGLNMPRETLFSFPTKPGGKAELER